MRFSNSKTLWVWLLLVCDFGYIHGQSRGSFSVPSISDILNDAMNLERAAANFDQSATNGNQQGAVIPGSVGSPTDIGMPPAITDAAGNAPPAPVGTHVDMPFEHGNNSPFPVIHRESTHLSDPHHSSGTGSHLDTHSQGAHPATDPFRGPHQEIGPRPDLHQPVDPVLTDNVHGIPGAHLDFPNEHGNTNDFPVVHVDPNPISGQHAGGTNSHTGLGANHNSRGNRGPSLIDIQDLVSTDFHGMSVHQTAPEFQADRGGFVDLGSTHQDPSSIFPNAGHNPGDFVDQFPSGPNIGGGGLDLGPGSNLLGRNPTDIFGTGPTLGGIASDRTFGPLGGIETFPSGPPARPIDTVISQIDHSNGHHGNPPVTPGLHHQPGVNTPVQPIGVSPLGSGVATPVGGGHDSHVHEGVHIDPPGVHGNQLNEAALHVPDGMTMQDIHDSGVLDALADTRAERGSSSPSSAANPASIQPVGVSPVGSGVARPVSVAPVGSGVATPVGGGHDSHVHEGVHIDQPGVHGNQLTEAALHVPDGMTMQDIHNSGVLDALADTRAERGSSSPSSAAGSAPIQPPTNVFPPNPFGSVGTVPGFPIDNIEPILPVVSIGLPMNSDNVPVRPGRRGRQDRRRRWRNRNGRRGRGRRIRPALEPVDVSVVQSAHPGHVHPTHARLPVEPPTQHNLGQPGFIHSSPGNVAIVPNVHPTSVFGGITGSPFSNHVSGLRNMALVPGHGRRQGGGPAGGGLLGELMRTAVQIGSSGHHNSHANAGSLFGRQHQQHRSPVQITRSGPMASGSHFHNQPAVVLGSRRPINLFGQQNQGQSAQLQNLQNSLGSTLINMLGGMIG